MKNFLIIVLSLACIYIFFFYKAPVNKTVVSMPSPEVEAYVKADVENIDKKITNKGFEAAVLEEVQNNIYDLKLVRDSAKAFKDSILQEYAKKDRLREEQIKSITQYAASWRDSFMVASRKNDTTFNFVKNGLQLEFVSPIQKKPYFNYSYDANLNYIEYWNKKNFFSQKKQYIDFWIEDTRATIKGVKRLRVEPKKDNFKLNINASGIYIDKPYVGPEIDINLGKLSLKTGYYYDIKDDKWKPIISTSFNILQF